MENPVWITAESALFLDFDGTLAELAPTPDAVQVAPGLFATLEALRAGLGGALAIVSGRPIAEIDRHLAPLVLPAAGVHGAERRDARGVTSLAPVVELTAIEAVVDQLLAGDARLFVEKKRGAIALHYRLAPDQRERCLLALNEVLHAHPDAALLEGKMVFEIKPKTVTKATAIRDFMAEAPFRGRRPVFVGDDVTDEVGFDYVQGHGGVGIKIGPEESVAAARLAGPEAVHRMLESTVQNLRT